MTPHLGTATRWGRLRVPSHRASSATLAGAYPFLTPEPCRLGALVGTDALTGEPFSFDPWALYAAGVLTNPNVALAGVIGSGKSALAKSLAVRAIASGRRAYVPGDPKGEWSAVAEQVGGVVLRLGPGLPARLNPLDVGTGDVAAQRSRVLAAVAESLLGRDLTPGERAALDAAAGSVSHDSVSAVSTRRGPVVSEVIAALIDPDPTQAQDDGVALADRVSDGRDIAHGLRRLVRGDLAGMFDAPSTVTFDPNAPMVVVDLSALGSDDLAVAVAMTCAASWLEAALGTGASDGARVGRWIIYDEAWRLLRSPALIRRMQAQWKLSRAHGIANLLVLHRLSDLDAVGAAGSEARALAAGLLADCSTRVIYRQESDQLTGTASALGLSDTERTLLPALPRGCGLWRLPRASYVVHHRLHDPDELDAYDTDAAMRANSRGFGEER
jgi:type IV secretory pathway VirB4 component